MNNNPSQRATEVEIAGDAYVRSITEQGLMLADTDVERAVFESGLTAEQRGFVNIAMGAVIDALDAHRAGGMGTDLEGLERLLAAATPGPWYTSDWSQDDGADAFTVEARSVEILGPGRQGIWPDRVRKHRVAETYDCERPLEDAALIAAAITILPALIAELRLLRAARASTPDGGGASTVVLTVDDHRDLCERSDRVAAIEAVLDTLDAAAEARVAWDFRTQQHGEYVAYSDAAARIRRALGE